MLEDMGLIKFPDNTTAPVNAKKERVEQWLQYSEKQGTLIQ